ncbi:MAG: GNAT family protein [Alphaproteobacteria bacterium]|uniref:GNAT family N-acetyltransferase n=1 Tax=Pacificispira sp. TaxID=2888761 RepID=UPI001B01DDC7|nr:GNAT family N-acetyltransferase [Alphaproteobacteria bacterium]MBO6863863.1 GNAT family N-acetyltransferase [Alphaproteobacteria bacterium]MEC9266742.1 GNAT family protein [Pseudomonadota bacterium]
MLQFFRHSLPRCRYAGPRIALRPPRVSDQAAWMAVRDRSKAFLEPWEPAWPRDALTPGAYRRRLHRVEQEWRSGVGYGFFIVDDGTDDLLGGITLANVRRGVVESANVGYWIAEQHARQGYMSEAIQVLLDFAFCKLNLHRVEAACLVHNEASRNLLLKSGFQLEGRARKYLCIAGRWQDHDTFGILRTDDRPAVPVIES